MSGEQSSVDELTKLLLAKSLVVLNLGRHGSVAERDALVAYVQRQAERQMPKVGLDTSACRAAVADAIESGLVAPARQPDGMPEGEYVALTEEGRRMYENAVREGT